MSAFVEAEDNHDNIVGKDSPTHVTSTLMFELLTSGTLIWIRSNLSNLITSGDNLYMGNIYFTITGVLDCYN